METKFGFDFSNVRIHTDHYANKSAKSINAKAYTFGNRIVFGEGQFNPHANEGRRLVAHELSTCGTAESHGNIGSTCYGKEL